MPSSSDVPREVLQAAEYWIPPGSVTWRIEPAGDSQSLNNSAWRWIDDSGAARYLARRRDPIGSAYLGISYELEKSVLEAASARGVTPNLIGYDENSGVLVSEYVDRKSDWTEKTLRDPGQRHRLLAALATAHLIPAGSRWPSISDLIQEMLASAMRLGLSVPPVAADASDRLRRLALRDARFPQVLSHHDVWPNNVIDDGDKVWLIDFEFAGSGSGIYDLATIAVAAKLDETDEQDLLDTYAHLAGRPSGFDRSALRDAIWVVHFFEAVWALVRSGLPKADDNTFDYAAHARRMFNGLADPT